MNHRDLFPKTKEAYGGEDLTFQLIDGNGNFNDEGLKYFARQANLYQRGRSYAVISIMGPQSSGKSTLLNHLFGTNFKMMDDSEGRSQTTLGIWLAKCPNIKPLTLVMDMEGSDGSERGEDDASFEKQSALFALAVADVVLINMWCQDIGREQAANKPLLRTVFQQVMIKFSDKPRKITLMFVVRDKTKSPENALEAKLKEDIEKIWASVLKPLESSNLQLGDFFKVEVVFLPNYEEREQDFKLKVKELEKRFVNSTAPGGLADTEGKEPASEFLINAQNIWNGILGNKDLDLPAHQIMVATARCEEIKNELYDSFQMSVELHNLLKVAEFGEVPNFAKSVNSILNTCLSTYDAETIHFDEEVANEKREELIHQCLRVVEHVYQAKVNRLRLQHLGKFMKVVNKGSEEQNRFNTVADYIQYCLLQFDKDCADIKADKAKWDSLKARAKLGRDMKSYAAIKREDRPAFIVRKLYEPNLKQEISEFVGHFLCEGKEIDPSWMMIIDNFKNLTEPTLYQLDKTLLELGVNEGGRKEIFERMLEYAKDVIGTKAREETGKAKIYMMRKFAKAFKYDYNSSPRNWKSSEEIPKRAESALYTPLKLLKGLTAIRLEKDDLDDNIDNILSSALLKRDQNALKDLESPTWEKVPFSRTLITPIQCKKLWEEFMVEVENTVNEALEAKLKEEIREHVRYFLCEETDPTWSKLREYPTRKLELTLSSLDNALSKFSNEEVRREKIERMQKHAKDVVKNKARQESFNAKNHMIIRFGKLFKYECNSRRDWRGDVQIEEAAGAALFPPLKVLAGLVAIRLEESDTDNIEDVLFSTLSHSEGSNTLNALDSPNWKEIPSSRTLITPIQCKLLWKDYLVEAKEIVNQARKDIELKKNADIVKKICSQIGGTVTTIFSAVWGARRSRGTHK